MLVSELRNTQKYYGKTKLTKWGDKVLKLLKTIGMSEEISLQLKKDLRIKYIMDYIFQHNRLYFNKIYYIFQNNYKYSLL